MSSVRLARRLGVLCLGVSCVFFFFFNDTATTEIYTLSLHDALPISTNRDAEFFEAVKKEPFDWSRSEEHTSELQSRGLISYAVFCLKKKNHQSTCSSLYTLSNSPHLYRTYNQL